MGYQDPVNNPFDSKTQDLEPQTIPLDEILRKFLMAEFLRLRVHMPCKVIAVNGGFVDVQPGFKTRYVFSNQVKDLPPIHNVPIGYIQGPDYFIKVPVAVGQTGYLVFADRNLDSWLAGSGDSADPGDSRSHDITDCVFMPNLVPSSQFIQDESTDMVLNNGEATVRIQKGGTFKVQNAANELLDVLDQITDQLQQLASTLSTDTVNTMLGPEQLNAFSTYDTISTAVAELKAKLETLKG